MNKVVEKIESIITPFSEWISSIKFLQILRKSMSIAIPVTLIGSLYLVILCFPILSNYYPPVFTQYFAGIFGPVYNITIPLLSLYIVGSISFFEAEDKDLNRILSIIVGLGSFFIVTPMVDGNLDSSWLGAQGMFVAIFSGFLASYIYGKMCKTNIKIKLPESVPPMVSEPFEAIIPALVTFTCFAVIRYIFALTSYGNLHAFMFNVVQLPLIGLSTSLPATIIVMMILQLLWFTGLHGGNIVNAVMTPMWTSALISNLDALANGTQPQYIVTSTSYYLFILPSILTPVLALLLFSKSEQNKAIGRVSLVPAIFNIGEPVIFGLPIVGNATLLIPWMLAPVVYTVILWIGMSTGFCPFTNGVDIAWTMPSIISGFLATGSIRGSILQIIQLVVGTIIYVPFIHVYDKQVEEMEQNTEE